MRCLNYKAPAEVLANLTGQNTKAGVSIATPATKPKGGQFVLHAKALHGNPFDGHTLGPVITELEQLIGVETRRIHVDKGYRGHNHKEKFRVWITSQVRRVTRPLRREMKGRAAVEPVIGHVKAEHRMGRNYLKGRDGDRINAVLAAAGYNSASSCAGWRGFCVPSSGCSWERRRHRIAPDNLARPYFTDD